MTKSHAFFLIITKIRKSALNHMFGLKLVQNTGIKELVFFTCKEIKLFLEMNRFALKQNSVFIPLKWANHWPCFPITCNDGDLSIWEVHIYLIRRLNDSPAVRPPNLESWGPIGHWVMFKRNSNELVHEGWLTKSPPSQRLWRAVSVSECPY